LNWNLLYQAHKRGAYAPENAEANSEMDSERVATEQEKERERAKKNAISVKNSTVSKNRLEVNDYCFLSVLSGGP